MKKLFSIIIYSILFLFLVVIFLPKQEIYNFALTKLADKEIIVQDELFQDKYLNTQIDNTNIYIKGIKSAVVSKITFETFIFYNKLGINDIKISENFKNFVPTQINLVEVKYSVLNPLFVDIKLDGDEFKGNGYIDLVNKKINLTIYPSNKFIRSYSMILKNMKMINSKEYSYEYSF
jgi:hypothetical protein